MYPALLDIGELEELFINLDASLNVHARAQFFTWTQGLLQSLVRHKALICAVRIGQPLAYRVDAFSTLLPDASVLHDPLLHDPAAMPGLIEIWRQQNLLPVICAVRDLGAPLGATLGRELERIEASHVALHGSADANGEASSLFLFAGEAQSLGASSAYLLQLVVPFLHAAWVRAQVTETAGERPRIVAPTGVLTVREREILRWIYLGKSNAEIGAILGISPLTVKNHVQKILRKLKVVNRAQAVGKALDARIIGR